MKDAYYFGCWDDSGHYLWPQDKCSRIYSDRKELPWGMIDGTLPPGIRKEIKKPDQYGEVIKEAPQGHAAIHYKNGWTAIAFWDRSVDRRPGSNSAFFFRGIHSFEDAIHLAKTLFPDIWKRFQFEIKLVVEADGQPPVSIMTMEEKAIAYERVRAELDALKYKI